MSKATVTFRELRFVIGDDMTHVYVLCKADGDCPLGVQGWHYKVFPPHYSAAQILDMMFMSKSPLKGDDPVLWPQKAPEERLEEWYRVHE